MDFEDRSLLELASAVLWEVEQRLSFHLRWAKKCIFERMIEQTERMKNRDRFKILDGSHVKAPQDACYALRSLTEQRFGKTQGGRNTKLHAMTNGGGRLLGLRLVSGNEHELISAHELLGDVLDSVVLADRGYDSDSFRKQVLNDGGLALVPPRRRRLRAVLYFKKIAKGRYVLENFFCRIKRYRRIETQYDRRPDTYLRFVFLAALMDCLK